MANNWAIIHMQWKGEKGELAERKFKFEFIADEEEDHAKFNVQYLLDWTKARKQVVAMAENAEQFDFGDPEYLDPECNEFIDVDAGTPLVNEGHYRVELQINRKHRSNGLAGSLASLSITNSRQQQQRRMQSASRLNSAMQNDGCDSEFDLLSRMEGDGGNNDEMEINVGPPASGQMFTNNSSSPAPTIGAAIGTNDEYQQLSDTLAWEFEANNSNSNIGNNNVNPFTTLQMEQQINAFAACQQPQQPNQFLLPSRQILDTEKLVRLVVNTASHQQLGQFYDCRNEAFIESAPMYDEFKGQFKNAEFQRPCYNFGTDDDYFALLNVNIEYKARILAEMCPLSGFAEVLKHSNSLTNNEVDIKNRKCFTFLEIASTKTQTMSDADLCNHLAKSCATGDLPMNASHVLTSICYGAARVMVFSTEDPKLDIDEIKKIVNNKLRNNFMPSDIRKWNEAVKVQIFADPMFDVEHGDGKCSSFLDALRLINKLPELIKKVDKSPIALGHPLHYVFTPLDAIVRPKYLTPTNRCPAAVNQQTVHQIGQIKQIFHTNQLALNQLEHLVNEFHYSLSEELYGEFVRMVEELPMRRHNALNACQRALLQQSLPPKHQQQMDYQNRWISSVAADGNTDNVDAVHDWSQEVVKQLNEAIQFFEYLGESGGGETLLQKVREKCQTAAWLRSLGVPYIGRKNADLTEVLARGTNLGTNDDDNKKCQYVLFDNSAQEITEEGQQAHIGQSMALFKQLLSDGQRCIYVDTALAKRPEYVPEGIRIVKFWNDQLLKEDYLVDSIRKLHTCIVRFATIGASAATVHPRDQHQDESAATEQFDLDIPCPKAKIYGGHCSNDDCLWECDDCAQLIIFEKPKDEKINIVEHFRCGCGRTPVASAKFRCKDGESHGDEFAPYPAKALAEQCQYFGEKNLLILGETGVGKSTWINAFGTFITYETMDDAIQTENPICLIPTFFPRFDKNLIEETIYIGPQDANESKEKGKSQTKMPKGHVFDYKTGRLRKIDTPGIADTAGMKQDEQNFKYTLRYIATLKELNGIAILLDANRPRVTAAFKYCIGQLLTHLHKDAAKNIVFVFTKCGQRKNPGSALSSLREYLDEVKRNNGVEVRTEPDNVYFMENDAFLFIHEIKHGIVHGEETYEQMARNWDNSKSESTRLLQYIVKLQPHKPMDTFSLNQARTYILALAQPLAKISQAIQTDITVLEDKQDFLLDLDQNKLDLETTKDAMKIPQIYYEIERLQYPRTVCISNDHTEVVVNEHGQQQVLYKTICHSQCGLTDVPPESGNRQELRGCWAMRGSENCQECGCHYLQHMHIRYLQHMRTKLVEDPKLAEVTTRLERTDDKKAAIVEMVNLLEKRVEEQKAEQAIISKHSAKLASFLKRNAIMTYNDAIEEYVLLSINDEKRIASVTNDYRKVEGLEECLQIYKEEKRIIDNALINNEQELGEFDVQAIYGELFNLPINGQNIKEMFEAEINSQKEIKDFSESSYSRQNRRRASKNSTRHHQFANFGNNQNNNSIGRFNGNNNWTYNKSGQNNKGWNTNSAAAGSSGQRVGHRSSLSSSAASMFSNIPIVGRFASRF